MIYSSLHLFLCSNTKYKHLVSWRHMSFVRPWLNKPLFFTGIMELTFLGHEFVPYILELVYLSYARIVAQFE